MVLFGLEKGGQKKITINLLIRVTWDFAARAGERKEDHYFYLNKSICCDRGSHKVVPFARKA